MRSSIKFRPKEEVIFDNLYVVVSVLGSILSLIIGGVIVYGAIQL